MLANPKRTKDEIVQWIRSYFESNGPGCDAVVGISGGKDSSVVAALCVEALGKERVVGVMMPNGEQPDLDDSKQLIEFLGIRYAYTDISKAVSAVSDQVALNMNVSDQTRINLPPRIRMATLYAISQSLPHGGRVANTCNRSEDYVGYSTKFGDSAGDFSPLANLMVHEVIQIGYELLLPINLISKIPSDGLCGKTDEDNLGFTYAHLDAYIMYGTSGIEEIDKKIASMHDHNLHKLNPMPAYGTTFFLIGGEKMEERTYLSGTSLAGMSPTRSRVENDYYATPFEATEAILSREELHGSILEPAAGEGHISKVLREHYPNSQIISTDLVQRDDRFGCGIVGGVDFLTENYPEKFNNVITNPPFSLAKEFAEKALEVSTGKVILFAKIQFLEGRQRKDFFATHPPKAVYVFSKRVNPLRNGLEVDENGKPWSSTMCFAWFVWEHGYTGEPCIRWI